MSEDRFPLAKHNFDVASDSDLDEGEGRDSQEWNKNGLIMRTEARSTDDLNSDDDNDGNDDDSDDDQLLESPEIKKLEQEISTTIESLGGIVFPKVLSIYFLITKFLSEF